MRKYLALVVALLWTMGAYANGVVGGVDLNEIVGTEWFGLYMNGNKVGYAESSVELGADGSVVTTEDAVFKLNMVGAKQDMRIYSKRIYGPDGALQRIESQVDDIAGTNRFNGTVEGDQFVLTSEVAGQKSRGVLPVPDESLEDLLKQAKLVQGDPHIGDTIEFAIFEPMYQTELAGVSEIVGIEKRVLDGVELKVFKFRTLLEKMGIESVSYVTEDGTVLEDRIAGGIITMRLEPEAMAKNIDYSNDVIVSNAARVDEPIADPRTREKVELRISGPLNSEHLFNNTRQKFVQHDGGYHFTGAKLKITADQASHLPLQDPEAAEWLKPSLFVQSDHPQLVEKAQEIVGNEANAFRVVEKLSDWVYDNVETAFSARLTNSLEVLDHMEGDCTEHSMLFIGLARAAGIPAREVAGLIYVEGPEPGFYFHQWATVWIGRWIDVDPTFNQPVADATHIKLAEGDLFEQAKLLPVIGQLKVEVVEAED